MKRTIGHRITAVGYAVLMLAAIAALASMAFTTILFLGVIGFLIVLMGALAD